MLFLGGQILSATVLMKRMNWPLVKISRLAHGHHRIDFMFILIKCLNHSTEEIALHPKKLDVL